MIYDMFGRCFVRLRGSPYTTIERHMIREINMICEDSISNKKKDNVT